jgi:hypothetical protein
MVREGAMTRKAGLMKFSEVAPAKQIEIVKERLGVISGQSKEKDILCYSKT